MQQCSVCHCAVLAVLKLTTTRVVATHSCEPQVLRNGVLHKQSYSRGEPTTPLAEQPAPADAYSSGTKVGGVGRGAGAVLFFCRRCITLWTTQLGLSTARPQGQQASVARHSGHALACSDSSVTACPLLNDMLCCCAAVLPSPSGHVCTGCLGLQPWHQF